MNPFKKFPKMLAVPFACLSISLPTVSCVPPGSSKKDVDSKDSKGVPVANVFLKRGEKNQSGLFYLEVAADPQMTNLFICDQRLGEGRHDSCNPKVPGYQVLKKTPNKVGNRDVYVTVNALSLTEQSRILLYYFNKEANQYVQNRDVWINDIYWKDMDPIVKNNCYNAGCHVSDPNLIQRIAKRPKDFAARAEFFKEPQTLQFVYNVTTNPQSVRHPEVKFTDQTTKGSLINYMRLLNPTFKDVSLAPAWSDVKPVVERACGGDCHNGAHAKDYRIEAELRAAKAQVLGKLSITDKPHGKFASDVERQLVINFVTSL